MTSYPMGTGNSFPRAKELRDDRTLSTNAWRFISVPFQFAKEWFLCTDITFSVIYVFS
jgi:hypothetical protein